MAWSSTARSPASQHTTVELSSVDLKRLQAQLEAARDVLAEWQVLHSENELHCKALLALPDYWEGPARHCSALAGVLGAIEDLKALERQLFARQRSRKVVVPINEGAVWS